MKMIIYMYVSFQIKMNSEGEPEYWFGEGYTHSAGVHLRHNLGQSCIVCVDRFFLDSVNLHYARLWPEQTHDP